MKDYLLIAALAPSVLLTGGCLSRSVLDDPFLNAMITIAPESVLADGSTSAEISVTVIDNNGSPLAGLKINCVSSDPSSEFSQPGVTDGSGTAHGSVRSSVPGNQDITAYATTPGGQKIWLPLLGHVTFTSPLYGTLVANPPVLVADGSATTTLTLSVSDDAGKAVPGETVALRSTGSGNTFGVIAGVTDIAGHFSTTLASTRAETKTITASVASQAVIADVIFLPSSPASSTSSLSANPNVLPADGVSESKLIVTVQDSQGNGVPGQAVTFISSGV